MQEEPHADSTTSDDQVRRHIARLTGKGGPFEISPADDEPPRFRRGGSDLRSLFNRVKMLNTKVQLRHLRDFSFGDVARSSRDLAGPDPSDRRYLGIGDDDPFTWMTEFMFAVSNGNVAVPISGRDHADAFRHYTGVPLCLDWTIRSAAPLANASAARPSVVAADGAEADNGARRPAMALFTSGTSGLPKPVFHSHEGVLTGLSNMLLAGSITAFSAGAATSGQTSSASLLLMCPLSYIAGTAQFLLSFLMGHRIVVPADRSATGLARIIEENRITSIIGIRRDELERLTALPRIEQRATTLRTVHIYGETLPPDQVIELRSVLPDVKIGQGYGMTEAFGPVAAFVRNDTDGPLFWKLPSIEATVLQGTDLSREGTGRLHIRGRNMMLGYAPPQGAVTTYDWFDTGDEVELSASGKLRILDRSSRVVVIESGRRIYLAEIEKRALQAGAPDAAAWTSTEPGSPAAYLALASTPEIGSELGSALREEFGVDLRILYVPVIPRQHGGKVDRGELEKMQSASDDARRD